MLRRDLAGESKIDGDVAVDRDHHVALVDLSASRRAREHHGLAEGLAKRRDPEVVLELGERLGKRLRDRPGAEDRSARYPGKRGGDGSRLEQPQRAVLRDCPLDVLWAAEHHGDRVAECDESSEIGAWQLRTVVRVELDHLGVRFEQVPRPADLAADELFGCTVHRGDDAPVGPARHGVDPEHHAAEGGLEQRLDQHRDRLVAHAGASA